MLVKLKDIRREVYYVNPQQVEYVKLHEAGTIQYVLLKMTGDYAIKISLDEWVEIKNKIIKK